MLLHAIALALAAGPPQDDPSDWRLREPGTQAEAWAALEGEPYPELAGLGPWINSDALSWSDLRGYVVLVHHFSTAKRPSTRLVPELVDLLAEHGDQGLAVLGVHTRRDAEACEGWVVKHGVPYLVTVDGGGKLARQASARRVPTFHLVGRDGRVRVAGLRPEPEVLGAAVRAALAEPWEGERRELRVVPRLWNDWRPPEPVHLPTGPEGWPVVDRTRVEGARDIRGEALPPVGVTHWLTEPVDLLGRPGLVVLWATTDGATLRDLPRLQAMHESFGEELVVLTVSEEAPDAHARTEKRPYGHRVREHFAKRPQFTFPVALDGRRELKEALRVTALPQALLVDSQGVVRWQGLLADPEGGFDEELLQRFLAVDRLRKGGTQARYDGRRYQLGYAPSGLRGLLYALPVRPRLLGPSGAWPLAVLDPVGLDGYLELEVPPAGPLGPGSLAWRPLRPGGFPGDLPATVAR